MSVMLTRVEREFGRVETPDDLDVLMWRTGNLMLSDIEDWVGLMQFADLAPVPKVPTPGIVWKRRQYGRPIPYVADIEYSLPLPWNTTFRPDRQFFHHRFEISPIASGICLSAPSPPAPTAQASPGPPGGTGP